MFAAIPFAVELLELDPAAPIRAAADGRPDPQALVLLAEDLLELAALADPQGAGAYRRARAILAGHGSRLPACAAIAQLEAAA